MQVFDTDFPMDMATDSGALDAYALDEEFEEFRESVGANTPLSSIDCMNLLSSPNYLYFSTETTYSTTAAASTTNAAASACMVADHLIYTVYPRPKQGGRNRVRSLDLTRRKLRELGQKYGLLNAARWLVSNVKYRYYRNK